MVLPGWNVSEPIDLAFRLYEVVESLRSAPESAQSFVSKIKNFSGNLKSLQSILETRTASYPTENLDLLRATVVESEACVKRCEEFSEGFGKLTKDGKGKIEATRWFLQEKRVARLSNEIDTKRNNISFTLDIHNFGARQDSHVAKEGSGPPTRSATASSLPPYSLSQPNSTPIDSLTPADLLKPGTKYRRKSSGAEIPNFDSETGGSDGTRITASPRLSPTTLGPLAEQDDVSPLFPSPTISSRRMSNTSSSDSFSAPESAVVEMVMENLVGVQVSYKKGTSRILYRISTIQSLREKYTGRRYIVMSPPTSFNIKLYLAPRAERIIAHSEHPQAYGSATILKVKFLEPCILRSQKLTSERRPSDVSSISSPSLSSMSSTASVASPRNIGSLNEESRHPEYDFGSRDDYCRFQEILMGPDVKLLLQVPIQSITSKNYEKKPTKESHLQYLRLWQFSGCQTMMFFANDATRKQYREYNIENLRPVELKSKTAIRLEVHLPGMVRRRSSSKSPLIIPKPSIQEQAQLGACTDQNDISSLDYLSIEFSSADAKAEFLREAMFHGSAREPTRSPFAFHSNSPTK